MLKKMMFGLKWMAFAFLFSQSLSLHAANLCPSAEGWSFTNSAPFHRDIGDTLTFSVSATTGNLGGSGFYTVFVVRPDGETLFSDNTFPTNGTTSFSDQICDLKPLFGTYFVGIQVDGDTSSTGNVSFTATIDHFQAEDNIKIASGVTSVSPLSSSEDFQISTPYANFTDFEIVINP